MKLFGNQNPKKKVVWFCPIVSLRPPYVNVLSFTTLINSLSLEMSTQALNARLTTLFESLKQTQQLITRLSKFPAQPGSTPSNVDEGDARVELGAEIHQSLKEQEEEFELLRQEVEDQTNTSSWSSSARRRDSAKDSQRTDLAAQITRLGEDLKM